ncbi:hypothetical protein [Staphylococcus haemolyticus]|uniref:hypothetical protein n=1 Tax=Staphylococcus haemolyticus TaxID=1283 RepID=UPI00069EF0B4|nr:hypothetical protein [Staphylococcus haemolyticus]MBE7332054.1 hypothetical protein [Staphylococcus haemolyticus]
MKKVLGIIVIALIFLGACGKSYEIKDVTKGFEDDDLNVKNEKKMSHDDFGAAPMKAEEAKIFVVESDKHARIMRFKNNDDLKQTKKYYDQLGKESAILYSHTYSKDNFLIQMNGDIEDSTFEKYKKSMDNTLK